MELENTTKPKSARRRDTELVCCHHSCVCESFFVMINGDMAFRLKYNGPTSILVEFRQDLHLLWLNFAM